MKIYPDGTKVIVRWSEVGKQVDTNEKFGGAPRIVAYDPAKDGVVPIGEPSKQPQTASTNAVPSASTNSVVSPEQPAKMDYTDADPAKFDEQLGPMEGFCFRTAVGVAFQQPLSGRFNGVFTEGDLSVPYNNYYKMVFQPGIRYDLETQYNVTDWFRTGLESAFIYNSLHSIYIGPNFEGIDIPGESFYRGSTGLGNGGLFQVPVLYTVSFRFPSDGPIKGYFGGGVGADWSVLQISSGGSNPYTSYHWNWAWQLTAGVSYTIMAGLDLDVGYKLLSMVNPNFQDAGQFKASYNHTAEIGLAWRF